MAVRAPGWSSIRTAVTLCSWGITHLAVSPQQARGVSLVLTLGTYDHGHNCQHMKTSSLLNPFKLSAGIFSSPASFDSLFGFQGALVSRNRIVKAKPGGVEQLDLPAFSFLAAYEAGPAGSKQ